MFYSATSSLYTSLPNTHATNGEYLFWWPYWQTIRDCVLGEFMIKQRKQTYLPKVESQTDAEYDAYLRRATFYNAASRTVSGLVGSVHRRAPVIEGAPDTIDLNNITNDGQSFDMFMKKITREVIQMGRFGVMIDAPPDGGAPYCVGYNTEDIVDWSTTRIGSREILQYVVLREIRRTRTPFATLANELEENYRVLFLDDEGIYRQRVYPNGVIDAVDYQEFTPLMQGRPMTEIPFMFISPYDFGYECEKPPILDIVLLNLSHYRSYAQLEQGRYYTATPVYTVFLGGGGDDDAEFKVGPNVVWQLGQQDKAQILEFGGAGLKFLESALLTKEQQIAALGGRLSGVARGAAAEAPEAIIARERGEASFLGSVISTISEAGSRILSQLAAWNGTPTRVGVIYSSEATEIRLDAREIRAMAMLYETGLVPLETIFTVFRQNNIIPNGLTFDEFRVLLPQQAPKVENKLIEAEGKAQIEQEYAPAQPPG